MPIPDTLAPKITADFRAEKSMRSEKFFVKLCIATQQLNSLTVPSTPYVFNNCIYF